MNAARTSARVGPVPILQTRETPRLPKPVRSRQRVVFAAVALATVAVALTSFSTALATSAPFLLPLAAVSAAGWYGGLAGGAVATVVTTVGVNVALFEPQWRWGLSGETDVLRMIAYVALAAGVTWFNANLHAIGQRLRASEYLSRVVLENAPALIAGADEEGRIVLFNDACQQATGFRREDVLGRPFVETLVPLAWRSQVIARFDSSSGIDLSEPHRNPWTTRSGDERLIEWRCYRVPFDGRALTVGVGTDVTDRKRLEDELAGRERFIATLSHEMRTPLSVVLGWGAHLRQTAADPDVRRTANYISRNAELINRLVSDVLDLARIAAGKVTMRTTPLELNAIVHASVDAVRPHAEAHNLTLLVQSSSDSIIVDGDPDRLQQMILNLIANAVKFTPAGGAITVSTRAAAGWAEVSVRDTGVGIDADQADKLFEPFWQGDGRNGGLGLGLALVRQLAQLHGGTAHINRASAEGGTVASFRLPLASYSTAQLA